MQETSIAVIEPDKMPLASSDFVYNKGITPLQRRFVILYIHGEGTKTGRQCAIEAGYAPGSAKVRAAEMLGNRYPLVTEALQKERDAMDEANKCNEQRSLAALRRIRDMAAADKSYAASVAAEYRRGSIVGLYVERKEIRTGTIDSMEREEVEKAIQKLKEDHSIETSFEEIKELENKS